MAKTQQLLGITLLLPFPNLPCFQLSFGSVSNIFIVPIFRVSILLYFVKMLLGDLAPIINFKTTVRAITCPKKLITYIIMPFVPATDFHAKPTFLLS